MDKIEVRLMKKRLVVMPTAMTMALLGPDPMSRNIDFLDRDHFQDTVRPNTAADTILTRTTTVRSKALPQVAV